MNAKEVQREIARAHKCSSCQEFHGTTNMYCGGPYGYICKPCHDIIVKYEKDKKILRGKGALIARWLDAKKAHRAWWNKARREAREGKVNE